MLEIKNVDQVSKQLDQWADQLEQELTEFAKGVGHHLIEEVAKRSAQASGDFAGNWNLSFKQPNYSIQNEIFGRSVSVLDEFLQTPPKVEGHRQAVDYAKQKAKGKLNGFQLGDPIFLTNASAHPTSDGSWDYYAAKIENNKIVFRTGNNGAPMRRTLSAYASSHTHITALTFKYFQRRGKV